MAGSTSEGTVQAGDVVDQLLQDWRRERPDLDAAPMAVVGRILHLASRLEARANEALKAAGLSYTDLDVLATLRRSGSPWRLTPTVLRRSVLLTSGAMTACLDRLEARGLLTRAPEPGDRRALAAILTDRGRDLADTAIGLRFAEAGEAVASLSPRERDQLAGLLRKLGLGL
jgi:DNA-binding MarR family transcriptional regulator